jgi:hypothetical protein
MAFTTAFLADLADEVVDFIDSNDGYDNCQLGEGASDPDNTNWSTTIARKDNTGHDNVIAGSKKSLVWGGMAWATNDIGATVSWTTADFSVDKYLGEIGLFDSGNELMARWVPYRNDHKRKLAEDETLVLNLRIYVSIAEVKTW